MPSPPRKLVTPAWRDFEELVGRIEHALAGANVAVKSPDRIPSLITRRKREVDASLRARIGSSELLITIECRKRKAAQDVTWIEQLGCKKHAIGAARTIAVTSTAFSADAIIAAAHYGIDLRILSEITEQDVQSWILPQSVTHVFKSCDLLESPEVIFHPEEGDGFDAPSFHRPEDAPGVNAPVFIGANGESLSFNDLWLRADDQLKIFDKVPTDDKVHTLRLVLQPSDLLQLLTPRGPRRVNAVKMTVALRWKHEQILLSDAKVVMYGPASPSDAMAKQVRAEFESKDSANLIARFGMQFEPGSDSATFTIETRTPVTHGDG